MKNYLIVFFTSLLFFTSCSSIKVSSYDVDLDKGKSDSTSITILQISDFHSNDFGDKEEKLIKKIHEIDADFILLTGDIFDFEMEEEKVLENVKYLLEGIKDYPFFYVSGNHEYYRGHRDEYAYLVEEYGGKVLNENVEVLSLPQALVLLAGLSDPFYDLTAEERRTSGLDKKDAYKARMLLVKEKSLALCKKLQEEGKSVSCKILLAHRPEYALEYDKMDFDLIFFRSCPWRSVAASPLYKRNLCPRTGLVSKVCGGHLSSAQRFH